MSTWYNAGLSEGQDLAQRADAAIEKRLENNAIGRLTREEKSEWLDGVLNGVGAGGGKVTGIRISNSLMGELRELPSATDGDFYRGIPFVVSAALWPDQAIHVVILGKQDLKP